MQSLAAWSARRHATVGGQSSSSTLRYGIAVLAVAVAWFATFLLQAVAPQRSLSLVFFFAAVAVSAGNGGLWPGVLATLLSALICDFFFLPPYHTLTVASSDLPLLVLFILVALLINGLSARLRAGVRAADRRFHDLVQGVDGIVWEATPSTMQFTFVSQRAEELLGYPVKQWLSEPDFRQRLVHPEDRESVTALCNNALKCNEDSALEYRAYAADGRMVWLRETVHIFYNNVGPTPRIMGLCVDITERKLDAQRLHQLSRQLVSIQEAERREIARELHDEIGQTLTGLKLSLETSLRLPPAETEANLHRALTLVNELMEHVDDLSLDLRPAMLDDLGLIPALLWHFDRYSELTKVRVHFEHTGVERRFPYEAETAAYRIVQEALTNVARHAEANEVTVRLWSAQGLLGIQVRDRGQGFDLGSVPPEASGLAGMEERASLLGGCLTIESVPGQGACLTAEIPLEDSSEVFRSDTETESQDEPDQDCTGR